MYMHMYMNILTCILHALSIQYLSLLIQPFYFFIYPVQPAFAVYIRNKRIFGEDETRCHSAQHGINPTSLVEIHPVLNFNYQTYPLRY